MQPFNITDVASQLIMTFILFLWARLITINVLRLYPQGNWGMYMRISCCFPFIVFIFLIDLYKDDRTVTQVLNMTTKNAGGSGDLLFPLPSTE